MHLAFPLCLTDSHNMHNISNSPTPSTSCRRACACVVRTASIVSNETRNVHTSTRPSLASLNGRHATTTAPYIVYNAGQTTRDSPCTHTGLPRCSYSATQSGSGPFQRWPSNIVTVSFRPVSVRARFHSSARQFVYKRIGTLPRRRHLPTV
jgi:hypothetical protein